MVPVPEALPAPPPSRWEVTRFALMQLKANASELDSARQKDKENNENPVSRPGEYEQRGQNENFHSQQIQSSTAQGSEAHRRKVNPYVKKLVVDQMERHRRALEQRLYAREPREVRRLRHSLVCDRLALQAHGKYIELVIANCPSCEDWLTPWEQWLRYEKNQLRIRSWVDKKAAEDLAKRLK